MGDLGLVVHRLELQQVSVAVHSGLLVLLEELLGALGEGTRQRSVTGLVHQELLITARGLLGIERELLAGSSGGIEPEQVPVAALDSLLHFLLAVDHAALDGVHLAGAVADDEGRAVVGLGLVDGLEGLSRVGAHGDLRHVDVAVAHGNLGQRLLLGHLTGSGELSDLAQVRGLGGLTTGVGVNLGVEDEDVDVCAGGEDVVDAAVADVVGPAVAAEDPLGALDEVVAVLVELVEQRIFTLLGCEQGFEVIGAVARAVAVVEVIYPVLEGCLEVFAAKAFFDGLLGVIALPPQMEVQPVALAIIMRSPKSCVMSLAYGVSPQPAQAPENSMSGCSNWLPMTVSFFIGFFFGATFSVSTP